MKTLFSLLTAFWLTAATLAQDTSPKQPPVSVKFTVAGWGEEITGLEYRQGASFKKIDQAPLFTRSKTFLYTGEPVIGFYKKTEPKPDASIKDQTEQLVASAAIPLNAKKILILLAPQGDRYTAMVVPDDSDAIPGGKALLINLCSSQLAIRANKTDAFALAAGEQKLVGARNGLALQVEAAYRAGTNWKKFDNFFIPLPAAYTTTVFFLHSDSDYFKNIDSNLSGPVQMVILRDSVEKPKEEATPTPAPN